jgi:hypothetical protein
MILMSTPPARIRHAALAAQVAPMEVDLAKRFANDASANFWAFRLVPLRKFTRLRTRRRCACCRRMDTIAPWNGRISRQTATLAS